MVSLVSDHTIPNILAIKHFDPDYLVFITTDAMEKKDKTEAILNTLHKLGMDYRGRYKSGIVKEDSLLDCQRKIDEIVAGKEDSRFIVNLTGGTKIMSIAAYEYFKDFDSKMSYIPLPKNEFITPFPKRAPGKPTPLKTRLKVIEYLTAYGLRVTNEKKLTNYTKESLSRRQLTKCIVLNYEELKNLLIWFSGNLRKYRDEKRYLLRGTFEGANKTENELIKKMGFEYKNSVVSKELTRSEIRFLTGGWLEEYCFNELADLIKDGLIDDLVLGLKLRGKDGTDNEFDLMFTRENSLYFIECKSLDQVEDKKTDILYKIGALQKEFGLKIKSFLVTTSTSIFKNGDIRPSVKARAEQFNTKIIHKDELSRFRETIKEYIT